VTTAHYFKLDRDTHDANDEYNHERQVKVELVQVICGNSTPPYRVFLDRFVPLEKLQIAQITVVGAKDRVSLLKMGS
jgi:hypothetical protein